MRQLRRDKQLLSLGIHTEVDQRVEGGVGHGQPEEGEEDVLGERLGEDVGVVVGVEEVGVVGQPTHPEHYQHHHEHDAHLGYSEESMIELIYESTLINK